MPKYYWLKYHIIAISLKIATCMLHLWERVRKFSLLPDPVILAPENSFLTNDGAAAVASPSYLLLLSQRVLLLSRN
jgi:hypothetical protein